MSVTLTIDSWQPGPISESPGPTRKEIGRNMATIWTDKDGQCSSPAASALATVLRTCLGSDRVVCRRERGGDDCYRVCSYREDFNYLWHLGRRFERARFQTSRRSTFVIVWDGMPPAPRGSLVHTDPYLTPLDWAVGFSITAQPDAGEAPDFRIFILDLASSRLPESDSVRYFRQFPPRGPRRMPWIRVFRPAGDDDGEPGAAQDLDLLPLAVLSDLQEHSLKFFTDVPAAERRSILGTVRRVWAATFSQPAEPGDHHALANLVGPLLLRRGGMRDSRARSVHVLLQQVGLVPSSLVTCSECNTKVVRLTRECPNCGSRRTHDAGMVLANTGPWIDWDAEPWKTAIARAFGEDKAALRFLLVDDNAFQAGWAEIVRMALGAQTPSGIEGSQSGEPRLIGERTQEESALQLFAVESADNWLTRIPAIRGPVDGEASADTTGLSREQATAHQRFNFDCGLPDRDGPLTDVLLLDLRLHQGRSLAAEADHFQRLLQKADEFCIDHPHRPLVGSLPWPGFTWTELELIRSWIRDALDDKPTARRDDPRYHLALSLLPRLISLIDCSLPIVLFSSTGRREILEFLKPYGNVITAFEKPRLSAIPDTEIAGHTADKFRTAIMTALNLTAARRMCRKLPPNPSGPTAPSVPAIAAQPPAGSWKIELLLDEEGDANPTLTVGGVLAVFPPGKRLKSFDDEFGMRHSQIRDNKKHARSNRETISEDLEKLAKTHDVFVAAVSVTGKSAATVWQSPDQTDDLHDERVADNLHRQLFRYLVELAVYNLARHQIPLGANVRFSVRAGSRHIPLKGDKDLEKKLKDRWGLFAEYIGRNEELWNASQAVNGWIGRGNSTDPRLQPAQDAVAALGKIIEAPSLPNDERPVWSVRHFRWDSPRPLVEELMGHYQGSLFTPTADIVRAFPLNSYGRPASEYIPVLHFFADALLAKNDASGLSCQSLWEKGFRAVYGLDLVKAVESHRLLLRGFLADSLTAYAGVSADARSDAVIRDIGYDLSSAANVMSGDVFLGFSRQLLDMASLPTVKSEWEGVVVFCQGDAELIIRDAGGRDFRARRADCKKPWSQFVKGTEVVFVWTHGKAPSDEFIAKRVRKKRGRDWE